MILILHGAWYYKHLIIPKCIIVFFSYFGSFLFVSIARLNLFSVYIQIIYWLVTQKCCSTHRYNCLQWPGIPSYISPVVKIATKLLRLTSISVNCELQQTGSFDIFLAQNYKKAGREASRHVHFFVQTHKRMIIAKLSLS